MENLKELLVAARSPSARAGAFVAGDDLTMGDIPVGTLCHRYYALGVERAPSRTLEAWYERLQRASAFRKHVMIPLE